MGTSSSDTSWIRSHSKDLKIKQIFFSLFNSSKNQIRFTQKQQRHFRLLLSRTMIFTERLMHSRKQWVNCIMNVGSPHNIFLIFPHYVTNHSLHHTCFRTQPCHSKNWIIHNHCIICLALNSSQSNRALLKMSLQQWQMKAELLLISHHTIDFNSSWLMNRMFRWSMTLELLLTNQLER